MARSHTPTAQIVVNKHAATRLALEGPVGTCEVFLRELHAACKRLGVVPGTPFDKPLRGAGNYPNIHDVIPWLEGIDASAAHGENRKFLGRLTATFAARCPDLAAKLDAAK